MANCWFGSRWFRFPEFPKMKGIGNRRAPTAGPQTTHLPKLVEALILHTPARSFSFLFSNSGGVQLEGLERLDGKKTTSLNQWLFLVPLKGGRWHIIPRLAVYTTWGYMLPTTLYRKLKNPLTKLNTYSP